jgi:hypothetical protein
LIAAVLIGGVAVTLPVADAGASSRGNADPNNGNTSGGVTPRGRVYATVSLRGGVVTVVSGPSGATPRGPVCWWTKSLFNAFDPALANLPTEIVETGTDGWYFDPATSHYVAEPGPGIETLYYVQCPGTGGRYLWVPPTEEIDRGAAISAAYAEMYDDIPGPTLNMNPRPEVGSVVNVGLWLAVDDPGEVSAVAEIGPYWAVTTAHFDGMTWEMGNGDVVDCSGIGVPYPEGANTFDQGPCGYTYTEQPPPDGYTITVTGGWSVQLQTSDGTSNALEPVAMAHSFAYDVNEIVTVGVVD